MLDADRARRQTPISARVAGAGVALPALAAAVVRARGARVDRPERRCALLPALALALLLALRRYPGERTLLALAPPASRGLLAERSALERARCRLRGPAVPRGGLLLACSLANRPPPGAALAAR